MNHLQRVMHALGRIRTAIAVLRDGGQVEAAQAAQALAEAGQAEAMAMVAEKDRTLGEICTAVEALADELSPPIPATDLEPSAGVEPEPEPDPEEGDGS